MKLSPLTCCLVLLLPLAGCEQLGLESMQSMAKKQDTEGKAIGGACRQAGRAIEDCYTLNRKTTRAPIYEGWREMDVYMRDNKLEATPPKLDPQIQVASAGKSSESEGGHSTKTDGSAPGGGSAASRTAWSPTASSAGSAASPAPRQAIASRSADPRGGDGRSETRSDSIWSARTAPAPAHGGSGSGPVTGVSAEQPAASEHAPAEKTAAAPSDKRLSELEEAARRMGLSTSVVR